MFADAVYAGEGRGSLPGPLKCLLTGELGRLAKWLRILGFDASYTKETRRSGIILQALREERMIVTRNSHFPARSGVSIVILRCETIRDELREILNTLKIHPPFAMIFTRCTVCNEPLVPAEKHSIRERVPAYVFQTQDTFQTCASCKRVYWRGTHGGNVEALLRELGEQGGIHR